MKIQQFLDELSAFDDPIPLETVKELMGQLELEVWEVENNIHFDDETYVRNLLRRTSTYEALLLCFQAGQRTPVHDHSGSACGVKVIQGTAVETSFEVSADGRLSATGTRELPQGGVVGSNDMDTHQLANLQSDERKLVTLHVYSPPLGEVGNYSIEENTKILVRAASRE